MSLAALHSKGKHPEKIRLDRNAAVALQSMQLTITEELRKCARKELLTLNTGKASPDA